ncbi:MAG TPA: PAS domain-containing protein [Nodosilinea sp.]|nr:PAS domain-containing protein [Nodosilinea sp.]
MTDCPLSHSALSEQGSSQTRPSTRSEADVLITAALGERPARQPDLAAENQAFATLAQQLTDEPQSRLKTLVQIARELCQADTVGVSSLETLADGSSVFRWVAIAGTLESWEQATAPSNFSPCGTTIHCGQPQLYARPERYFTYLHQPQFPIIEGLLIPICTNDQPLGTLWILSHTEQRRFDREDLRLMTSLTGFAAAALQSIHLRQTAELGLQAEQALQKSEAQSRNILESITDGFFALDQDWRFTYVNPQAERILNRTPGDLLDQVIWEVYPGTVGTEFERAYHRTASERVASSLTSFYPDHNCWYEVYAYPAADGITVYFRNVTEKIQAEAALRESEEKTRNVLESIAEAFFALDENWRFTYMNQSGEALLDRRDLIGKDFWQEYPSVAGSEFETVYRKAMHDRVPGTVTAFYPDHDRWYDIRTYPAATGIAVYFNDVTEQIQTAAALRQSEERYRTLFEAIDEGFCVVEVLLDAHAAPIDYRVLEVNPMFERQTGLQQAVGKTARQLNLEEHLIKIYGRVALTGEAARFENSSVALDRWFDLFAYRLGEPEARKVAIVCKDISDRKRAEALSQRTAAFDAFRVSLTDALRPLADPVEVQATASHVLGQYLGANRVAYFEVCGADYVVEQDYVNGASAMAGCYPIDSFGPTLLAAYRAGHTVVVADVQADPHLSATQRSAYAAVQIGAYIGIPLIKRGEFVAGLAVHAAQPRAWTPDEIALVEEVAERTWAAVERVRAEVALQQTSTELERQLGRFDAIATSVPDFIYTFDRSGRFTYFNPQLLDLFQKTSAEVLGKTFFEIDGYPADLAAKIHAQIQQVIETHQPLKDEAAFTSAAGPGDYEYVFVPLYDANGAVEAVAGVTRDITHRKQAEQALRQSEERFQAFMDHSPTAAWITDRDGRVLYLSQTYFRTFQFLTQDVLGKTVFDLYPKAIAEQFLDNIRQAADTQTVVETTEVAPRSDGTMGDFLVYKFPIADNSGESLVGGVAIDITERKQAEANLRESEERFRTLADQMSQFAWMADKDGSIFWYNRRWFEYTGTTLDAMLGWGWQQIHHPEHVDRVVEHFRHCIEVGEPWEDTFPLRSKDGTYGWFLSRAVPIRDAAGNILRWFGTNTDITERLQVEQEREQLLEQEQAARAAAERTNQLKDEFLAVLSHELRSPLNPILGWARLLRGGKLDPVRTDEALATIERNAKLQCQLIDDLLDISRIMQGKLVLNAAPVSLAFVISSAIETVQLAAEAKRIAIAVYSEPNVGQVAGDAGRLQQVVWNLLTNAVKFTPPGGRVDVRLTQVNHQARLQVSDTGKGITPEFLPYVFEHFRQEDGATTRKFGGLGLGLAIAKQIVTLHGGRIWVESLGEDQGATLTVELPCLQIVNSVEDVTNPILVQSDTLPLTNLRVLIVDDEPDSREFVAFVVEQAGADVTAVSSAIEALQQLSTTSFDLLLSDIGMPEMDGYELMRQLSQISSEPNRQVLALAQPVDFPAIALTAYAGEMNQQQALAAGFQGHLTKPVEPDELIKAIMTMMGSNRARLSPQRGSSSS